MRCPHCNKEVEYRTEGDRIVMVHTHRKIPQGWNRFFRSALFPLILIVIGVFVVSRFFVGG